MENEADRRPAGGRRRKAPKENLSEEEKARRNIEKFGTQPLIALICSVAAPTIGGMIISALYQVVDSIFIGRFLGNDGLAASSVVMPLEVCITCQSVISMATGASAQLSPSFGDKKFKAANYSLTLFCLLACVYSILACIVFLPWIGVLVDATGGSAPGVHLYSMQYLNLIIPLGGLAMSYSNALGPCLRAENRATLAMGRQILGAVLNILFDVIFFFGANIGMYAAGLSSILSMFIVGIWMLFNVFGVCKGGKMRVECGLLSSPPISELEEQARKDREGKAAKKAAREAAKLERRAKRAGAPASPGASGESPASPHVSAEPVEMSELRQNPEATSTADAVDAADAEEPTGPSNAAASTPETIVIADPAVEAKPTRAVAAKWFFRCSGQMLALGIPSYINSLPQSVGVLICNVCISMQATGETSTAYRAALGLTSRVQNFCNMIPLGVYMSFLSILGYHLGARLRERTYKLFCIAIWIMLGITLLITILCEALGPYVIAIFSSDSELQVLGGYTLRICMAAYTFTSFSLLASGIAQLQHKPIIASVIQLTRVGCTVILQFSIPYAVNGGEEAKAKSIFLSFPLADLISGVLGMAFFIKWTLDARAQARVEIAEKKEKEAREGQAARNGELATPDGVPKGPGSPGSPDAEASVVPVESLNPAFSNLGPRTPMHSPAEHDAGPEVSGPLGDVSITA